MTDQLTGTGLAIDDLETRNEALRAAIRARIGANLDLSTDQPEGQFLEIFGERIQAILELLQEVYTILNPDEATGDALTALAVITGTTRRAASYGVVTLTLTLEAGITVPTGALVAVTGQPDNQWATTEDVTSVGAGDYDVVAQCTVAGPVQALAGTITVIVSTQLGWTAVTNDADATEGLAAESDVQLRLRRELELTRGGGTSTTAIRADLLDLDGCTYAKVYDNPTDFTDAAGRPPHSVEAVVEGPSPPFTDAVVAAQIYESKAAGVRAYGTTTVYHTDPQGVTHAIAFTRATLKDVDLELTVSTNAQYEGDNALKVALQTYGDASVGVGDDVIKSRLIAVAFEIYGVEDVTIRLRFTGDAWGVVNLVVAENERAVITAENITIL